jgi:hypothetical protein
MAGGDDDDGDGCNRDNNNNSSNRDDDDDDDDNYYNNNSSSSSPLPRSKRETEGAIIFLFVLTSRPPTSSLASRCSRGGFLFFSFLFHCCSRSY